MNSGHVYIVGSLTGTLYTGVTSDLRDLIRQHKQGIYAVFSKRYACTRLLYAEPFHTITEAITREKQIKNWTRAKKLALIQESNLPFTDLAETWFHKPLGSAQSRTL